MLLKDLAGKIRSQREKRGLKQQDIANALNVSPQAVSKWERAENAPDIAVLAPLAQLLDVTTDWLLSVEEKRPDVFEATVLVSSIFGAYSKSLGMTARDFASWANGVFFTLTEITLRYAGVPIKYMGDQYLCFFSGPDHRNRAVKTAVRAKAALGEDLRIGLSSGEVYLGVVGHPDYARPDIMGEVVNIAFLTMQWAETSAKSGVGATAAVAEQAGETVQTGASEVVTFRDIASQVRVYEIRAPEP
jgi:class 3 adenylate cyclase